MKAMKAPMKSMKKAMKKSIKCKKFQVFKGIKVKTTGGLKKTDLIKNKHGKVVSKKQSIASKAKIGKWGVAVVKARKALGIKGFTPIGGKTAAGQTLLKKVRSFYKA